MPSLNPASGLEQCQPVLRTDASNVWSAIELEIQRIDAAARNACAKLGIEAYVGRNNAFDFNTSVYFEAWIPVEKDPYLTERVWAQIFVQPKPWHRFPIEYRVKTFSRGREKDLGLYGTLADGGINALISHLVRGGSQPELPVRILEPHHRFWHQLVYTKNKPVGTRPSYGTNFLVLLVLGSFYGMYSGYMMASSASPDDSATSSTGGMLLAASIVVCVLCFIILVLIGRQPWAVRSTGRPDYQPRVLRVYDSWQVVLFGAGPSRDVFYERFLDVLRHTPIPDMKAEIEPVAYRILGELIQREQIVLSARRGIVYCQIYPFGNDLYVGWQSFLNRGRWNEVLISSGIDKATGRRVRFQGVSPGSEGLCDFDYADTNCLTEWTHAQMVALIRQLMAELKIEQEIDFKIVRSERSGADTAPQAEEKKKGFFRRKS